MLTAAVPLSWYLILSAILFALGVAGFLYRRNIITVFMSIELMLNAVNLTFITFSYQLKQVDGHIFSFFVMVVAAAEAAVGLAIILTVFKNRQTLHDRRHQLDEDTDRRPHDESLADSDLFRSSGFLINGLFGRRLSKSAGQRCCHRLGAALVPVGAQDAAGRWPARNHATSSTTSPGSKAAC